MTDNIEMPGWAMMWMLACAVWLVCKLVTWISLPRSQRSLRGAAAYFAGWPGMDPKPFAHSVVRASNPRPTFHEWLSASAKALVGVALIGVAVQIVTRHPFLAGWTGMIGTVLLLHFGLFNFISLTWRSRGVAVEAIMRHPLRATSLADFWGRWNRGFRDLA